MLLTQDPMQPALISQLCGIEPEDVPQYLLDASADELIRLTAALSPHPWVDGVVFAEPPHATIAAKEGSAIPLLVGMVAEEGEMFTPLLSAHPMDDASLTAMARSFAVVASGAPERADSYVQELEELHRPASAARLASLAWTDIFRRSSMWAAEATAQAGANSWHYVLDVPCTMAGVSLPAAHGVCLPFSFNWFADPERSLGRDWVDYEAPELRVLAENWVAMIASFARTGEARYGSSEWPAYGASSPCSLLVQPDGATLIDARPAFSPAPRTPSGQYGSTVRR
jgi:carboxylesterase type B